MAPYSLKTRQLAPVFKLQYGQMGFKNNFIRLLNFSIVDFFHNFTNFVLVLVVVVKDILHVS